MYKLNKIYLFMFLFIFAISCDSKNETPSNAVKVQDQVNIEDNSELEFSSKGTKAFPCLDRNFSVDKIAVVDKNTILFKVTNVSADAIPTIRLKHIELRPIRNGQPTKVRSKFDIAKIVNDRLEVFEALDDVYPGESALVIQKMVVPFTQCEDYAIAYSKYACKYNELDYVKLSEVVDCNSVVKQ